MTFQGLSHKDKERKYWTRKDKDMKLILKDQDTN